MEKSQPEEKQKYVVACSKPYPISRDVSSGLPIHHLSFILKYFLPVELVHDENVKKTIECEIAEGVEDMMRKSRGDKTTVIYTGSVAEGLCIPDYFDTATNKEITADDRDKIVSEENHFKNDLPFQFGDFIEGEAYEHVSIKDGPPNYAHLKATERFKSASYLIGKPLKQDFLSNTARENNLPSKRSIQSIPSTTSDGTGKAIQSDKDQDIVRAISYSKWPDIAVKWMFRERPSNWPTPETRLEIVKSGHHMVDSCLGGPKDGLAWMYSFPKAEKILAQSLTKEQRQVFALLKVLHSVYLKSLGGFSSYCLKTVFYWTLEKMPVERFYENNAAETVFALLDEMAVTVAKKYLEHYFIQGVNLLQNTSGSQCRALYKQIKWVRNNILDCILQIDQDLHFTKLKARNRLKDLFGQLITAVDKDSDELELFANAVVSGLFNLVDSYLSLLGGVNKISDIDENVKITQQNLLVNLCMQAIWDLRCHVEDPVEWPSDLHFLTYTLSYFQNRTNATANLLMFMCVKVGMTKTNALEVINAIMYYCKQSNDVARVLNLAEVKNALEKLDCPSDSNLDNSKIYVKSQHQLVTTSFMQGLKI